MDKNHEEAPRGTTISLTSEDEAGDEGYFANMRTTNGDHESGLANKGDYDDRKEEGGSERMGTDYFVQDAEEEGSSARRLYRGGIMPQWRMGTLSMWQVTSTLHSVSITRFPHYKNLEILFIPCGPPFFPSPAPTSTNS